MWLKLGISKPKALGNQLRKMSKAKQAEKLKKEKARIEKEKAKKRKLAKSEAKIMFDCLKQEFVIAAKKGRYDWHCNFDYFTKTMEENNLYSDEYYLYEELKNICERNNIKTSVLAWNKKTKLYDFYWD